MARSARKKSETGIYHVLLRSMADGFFQNSEDFEKFLELLKQNKKECGYFLYAFVLFKEEVRLLIRLEDTKLETIFKKLCVKYSYWYNCKYNRRGAVFFDRFKSEPVSYEDFDDVFRFIIRYPEKYGIQYDVYPYSSLINSDKIDVYKKIDSNFLNIDSTREYLSTNVISPRITDETAVERILSITGVTSIGEALKINYYDNKDFIKQMIDSGIGYRQITRILGINYLKTKKIISDEDILDVPIKLQIKNKVKTKRDEIIEPIDFFLL